MTTTPSLQRLQKENEQLRAEYARLKGLPENYDPVTAADVPYGERIVNDPVDTTSYRYITDLTQYWSAKSQRQTDRGKRAAKEAECKMIAAARAEYVEQSTSSVRPVSVPNNSTDERVYTLSGRQTTETTRGIVIKDGQKVIR